MACARALARSGRTASASRFDRAVGYSGPRGARFPPLRPTAAPLAPPPGHPRFPLMDSMRALAALSVFGYHVGYVTGANQHPTLGVFTSVLNVGVPIFFVISGFLLYRPFVAARHGAPRRRVRDYARNRVLRIVPAYWVALTAAAGFPGLMGVFTGDWPWYYGFAQIYSPQRALLGLPVAWTLAVEVSFYLLLPVYALVVARMLQGRARSHSVAVEFAPRGAVGGLSGGAALDAGHDDCDDLRLVRRGDGSGGRERHARAALR